MIDLVYESKQFHYQYFRGNSDNAIIILIHGLGEHSGRFEAWAKKFNPYNYTICALDLPGHGLSNGQRGHFRSINYVYELLGLFINQVKQDFPNKPIILYGHSMGGNIAANYVIEKFPEIKGLILTSPWIRLAVKPNVIRFWLAKFMYSIFPNFPDSTNLNPDFISRIPSEVANYKLDKLNHGKITPGLFVPIFFNGLALLKKAKKIYCPTFIAHGSADMLTSHSASNEFSALNDLIKFKKYDGGYHELHHDECREELLEDILDWLSVNVVMK